VVGASPGANRTVCPGQPDPARPGCSGRNLEGMFRCEAAAVTDLGWVWGSPGRCGRPGLSASGHATLTLGVAGAVTLAAGVTRRLRANAAAAPISDSPARPNAHSAAM
jgi:hypothetical protein